MPTTAPARTSPISPLAILGGVSLESLTLSADVMPGHFIARARIHDLQPSQMIAAILVTEDAIKATHPLAQRTGSRAACDGPTVYFSA